MDTQLLTQLQEEAKSSSDFAGVIPPVHALLAKHFGVQQGILQTLLAKKGQFGNITYRRPLKLRAQYVNEGMVGEKLTGMNIRCGLDYSNIQAVIEKKQENNSLFEGKLIGREWVLFPYLLQTLGDNPHLLFRFYTIEGQKAKSRYFIDGQEVAEEALPTYCLSSEYKEREDLACFDLRVDYIIGVK